LGHVGAVKPGVNGTLGLGSFIQAKARKSAAYRILGGEEVGVGAAAASTKINWIESSEVDVG
jgi:hypothetical protein